MSEQFGQPDPTAINHVSDGEAWLQFGDGEQALGYNEVGTEVDWSAHRYAGGLEFHGGTDMAIVGLEEVIPDDSDARPRAARVLLGHGVAVFTDLMADSETGITPRDKERLSTTSIDNNLPNVTIGESWELVGPEFTVKDVVVRHKNSATKNASAVQVKRANPFPDTDQLLEEARQLLDEIPQQAPESVDQGKEAPEPSRRFGKLIRKLASRN